MLTAQAVGLDEDFQDIKPAKELLDSMYKVHAEDMNIKSPLLSEEDFQRIIAQGILEVGYLIMKEAWKPAFQKDSVKNSIQSLVDCCVDLTNEKVVERINSLEIGFDEKFNSFLYPIREFHGLISGNKKDENFISPGGYPLISAEESTNSHIKEIWSQVLLPFGISNFDHVYYYNSIHKARNNQEIFLDFQREFDSKSIENVVKLTYGTIPENIDDLEFKFAKAFAQTIDDLGGPEKFLATHANFYNIHNDLYERITRHKGNSAMPKSIHFVDVTQKKLNLYELVHKIA